MNLDPDSPMSLAARFYPKAPCDLHSKLPTRCSSETKMSRRPYWTLACPRSTCSGWNCRLSWRQSVSSSSVALFHLQASSTRTHAYTTSHKTPPVGVQSQGIQHRQAHMLLSSRFPNGKCSLQSIQWSTIIIYPIRRYNNLIHYTTLALI